MLFIDPGAAPCTWSTTRMNISFVLIERLIARECTILFLQWSIVLDDLQRDTIFFIFISLRLYFTNNFRLLYLISNCIFNCNFELIFCKIWKYNGQNLMSLFRLLIINKWVIERTSEGILLKLILNLVRYSLKKLGTMPAQNIHINENRTGR